jgi:RNA polymerase sigma factor (sigma-70 family)
MPEGARRGPLALAVRPGTGQLAPERVGQALGEWKDREIRIARRIPGCQGLNTAQLEDLYQETLIALLNRSYEDEKHLHNALLDGLTKRTLNMHRDERRRREILEDRAPELDLLAQLDEYENNPEAAALVNGDRSIVRDFMSELNKAEKRVFRQRVKGIQYRAIASALDMPVNEARNISRACERKRERFQLLYDSGRLCGYRSTTIQALQSGKATSEEIAERAFAHLESCRHCREDHKTNAKRLRLAFQDQAAALLPFPALAGHLSWLARLGMRARLLQHRLLPQGSPFGGGVRERAAALLAGGGVSAKVALTVATVAVVAGGTIGAKTELQQPRAHHGHHTLQSTAPVPQVTAGRTELVQTPLTPITAASTHHAQPARQRHRSTPRHLAPPARRVTGLDASTQREPRGFAYLGVPTGASAPVSSPEQAHTASHSTGGAFSP